MNKKIILISVILAVAVMSIATAEQKFPKPKKNEVVVIARAIVDPPVNDEFFAQYHNLESRSILKDKKIKDSEKKTSASLACGYGYKRTWGLAEVKDGVYVAIKVSIPKDKILRFPLFECYPANYAFLKFYLPVSAQIMVPEGVNYVYLGTFTYKVRGLNFEVIDMKLIDEFDAASAFVAEKYGKDAKLMRVPLGPIEEVAEQ